jgi:hypothetical protein
MRPDVREAVNTTAAVAELATAHPEWVKHLRTLVERGAEGNCDDIPPEAMREFARLGLVAYWPEGSG